MVSAVSAVCALTDLLNPKKAPTKVRGVDIPNLRGCVQMAMIG